MANLKWVLEEFCRAFFEVDDVELRFRASHFPFTEPSAEVDLRCSWEGGRLHVGEGDDWMEILGCGMVHPKVLEASGVDPDEWQGFAFGIGIDRLAMLKYGIPDLRAFFDFGPAVAEALRVLRAGHADDAGWVEPVTDRVLSWKFSPFGGQKMKYFLGIALCMFTTHASAQWLFDSQGGAFDVAPLNLVITTDSLGQYAFGFRCRAKDDLEVVFITPEKTEMDSTKTLNMFAPELKLRWMTTRFTQFRFTPRLKTEHWLCLEQSQWMR